MVTSIGDWLSFSAALALTLARMPTNGCLILTAPGNRFAQFTMVPEGLWAEVADDSALTDSYHILPDERDQLTADGWNPPSEGGSPNWNRQLGWPTRYPDYETLAERVVAALHHVLKVTQPTELSIDSWVNFSEEEIDVSALA
ncbi:hypothetical protein OHB26_19920 [Nocardia sp. NBC_01503]|uniref:TY-Chap domain-containing protein n=1 Tax=Nocardia sp. NBC_01503 TaxID=2975997 RepID=UPI002E7BA0BF|nr:hypothetical protein [Nocardia sp. NBC_01503]WTL29283.1 hypothetical protein OHB26_19920 [Nocardia sp. NBC_01503]